MGTLGQMKDMYKIQKQAKQIKKKLAKTHIEADVDGVIVIIDGEQKVVEVKLPVEFEGKNKVEKQLVEAFNKAIKKSQSIAADEMKDVMDQMGLSMPAAS